MKSLENQVSYRKEKGADFSSLQQGQLNIKEYVAKFIGLLKFAPHIADNDEAQADQFINGLNPDFFTLVNAGRPNNFVDALNHAKGAEAVSYRKEKGADFSSLQQGQLNIEEYVAKFIGLLKFAPNIADNDEGQADQFKNGLNPDVFTCHICNQTGHLQESAHNMVQEVHKKGAEEFLIYSIDVLKTSPKMEYFPVVSEFADVFPDEIPGFAAAREVDFSIELIPGDGISVDQSKVEAVISWPRHTSVPEIWSFMGLAGYYQRFIKGLSCIANPITQLTQKNAPYIWTESCEASFIELKKSWFVEGQPKLDSVHKMADSGEQQVDKSEYRAVMEEPSPTYSGPLLPIFVYQETQEVSCLNPEITLQWIQFEIMVSHSFKSFLQMIHMIV
ncbi:uncharacterized protein [Henckelia pumila]|uniref:uncharacterized protein n=1 Tax=Henckelia pumila TaxID=405737 RepID=UPI003C6E3F85